MVSKIIEAKSIRQIARAQIETKPDKEPSILARYRTGVFILKSKETIVRLKINFNYLHHELLQQNKVKLLCCPLTSQTHGLKLNKLGPSNLI